MKSFQLAIVGALALGIGVSAHAQGYPYQYPYERGYPSYGYDRGPRDGSPAYQIGREDGRRDGEHDLMTGHSFRPEHSGNFHHADRGYRHYFGDKQYYRDQYRAGYMEGYQRGYRSGGYGGYGYYRR